MATPQMNPFGSTAGSIFGGDTDANGSVLGLQNALPMPSDLNRAGAIISGQEDPAIKQQGQNVQSIALIAGLKQRQQEIALKRMELLPKLFEMGAKLDLMSDNPKAREAIATALGNFSQKGGLNLPPDFFKSFLSADEIGQKSAKTDFPFLKEANPQAYRQLKLLMMKGGVEALSDAMKANKTYGAQFADAALRKLDDMGLLKDENGKPINTKRATALLDNVHPGLSDLVEKNKWAQYDLVGPETATDIQKAKGIADLKEPSTTKENRDAYVQALYPDQKWEDLTGPEKTKVLEKQKTAPAIIIGSTLLEQKANAPIQPKDIGLWVDPSGNALPAKDVTGKRIGDLPEGSVKLLNPLEAKALGAAKALVGMADRINTIAPKLLTKYGKSTIGNIFEVQGNRIILKSKEAGGDPLLQSYQTYLNDFLITAPQAQGIPGSREGQRLIELFKQGTPTLASSVESTKAATDAMIDSVNFRWQPRGIDIMGTGGGTSFNTADDIKAAVQSGQLDRASGLKILKEKFGYQ